ncbi:hypothetical protein SJAV_00280 [Sulfurisphaera javensis]|uniref:Uncharacterized protein n=1 Tax=Sulfurisphaera javensis TaxID=2049879 RepID=A0AAT9GMG8_9CREN
MVFFVPKEQVVNDFKVFINRFLKQIDLTIDDIMDACEKYDKYVHIDSNLNASVDMFRIYINTNRNTYVESFYKREYTVSELFKLVNYILFLDPSLDISVGKNGLSAKESLWEIIKWRSGAVISKSLIETLWKLHPNY